MEDEALALDRDIAGRDHRLSGRLRITSSETLAYRVLTRHLAAFRQAHPGIVVELVVDNRVLSLSRREADIALRPIRPKEGDLWGRKLADVAWTLYGAPVYLEANGGPVAGPSDLGRHSLIGWEEGTAGIQAADWLGRAGDRRRLRVSHQQPGQPAWRRKSRHRPCSSSLLSRRRRAGPRPCAAGAGAGTGAANSGSLRTPTSRARPECALSSILSARVLLASATCSKAGAGSEDLAGREGLLRSAEKFFRTAISSSASSRASPARPRPGPAIARSRSARS